MFELMAFRMDVMLGYPPNVALIESYPNIFASRGLQRPR